MDRSLTPHELSVLTEEKFKIKILDFLDEKISSMCLVFYKEKYLSFENGIITDAIVMDEDSIELEILTPTGRIIYGYYYGDSSDFVNILEEDSEIILSQKCEEEVEAMSLLVHLGLEIFDQSPQC